MKATLLFTLALLTASVSLGNGGGYVSGGMYGSVIPFDMRDIGLIAMDTEDLRIEVGPTTSQIHVRYTMRNTTSRRVECRFGFPLELTEDVGGNDAAVAYEAKARGVALPHRRVKESPPPRESAEVSRVLPVGLDEPRWVNSWMVSELTAEPGETFELEIRLNVPNRESYLFISSNWEETKSLHYRFSSAAVWNGPIKRGHVEIVPRVTDAAGMKVLKPANRFTRREDGAWVWDFVDLEPTLDDDVTVQVIPEMECRLSTVIEKDAYTWSENYVIQYGDRWVRGVDITDWKMSASQTSARPIAHFYRENLVVRPFDVAQLPRRLRYGRHDDVWGTDAPNHGVGQSVTLTFKQPVAIGLLTLLNGWKKEGGGSYKQYGRVTGLKVIVNGTWSREFALDQWSALPLFGSPAARTVKLVITSAEPGSEFPETCLSDLQVWRRLPEKPQVDPCR